MAGGTGSWLHPAPSLDSAPTHTPLARPAVCRIGRETSRIPEVPSAKGGRPLENPACLALAGLRLRWVHVAAPGERADQPLTPNQPHSPLPVYCKDAGLGAWLRAADVPAHLRLPRPDSPRLAGLTGSPNKVSRPRGRPALTPGYWEQKCIQVEPRRERGAGVPSSRDQNMEGRPRLCP